MLFLLFLLIVCALLCELVSVKSALSRVSYSCRPSQSVVEPGEEFQLLTIIQNGKWLPVSYLEVVQNLPHDICLNAYLGHFQSDPTVCRLYSSCFLGPRQKLTRRIRASLPQRGRRIISDATITGGDLLGFTSRFRNVPLFYEIVVLPARVEEPALSRALGGFLGDVSVQRFILEDPMLTIGAREYTGREPMKSISWKHSVRTGHLMVKELDHTVENTVTVLLNVEGGSHEELERCFSLTRMVLEALEKRGFSCSFLTNAATAGAIGQWNQVSDGLGSGHTRTILEGLGRATYDVREPFSSLVNRAVRGARDGQAHILITPAPLQRSDAFLAPLFQQSQGRLFIINAREDGMGSQEVSG